MSAASPRALLYAALAGAGSVFAFAPFGVFALALPALGVLVWLLERAATLRAGFLLGLSWGFGAFVAGVSWLYVALNHHGGLAMPLAALAIALFCGYLALYPALVGGLYVRLRRADEGLWRRALRFAALWVLGEWLRGVLLTGFPWLAIGYSQTPPSPLAGFLPLFGVYGVGGLLAWLAALGALLPWRSPQRWRPLLAVVGLLLLGAGLRLWAWTEPVGTALKVALVQTNIAQALKWSPEHYLEVLRLNARLVRDTAADLVVLPESTLPALAEQLPEGYLDLLASFARARGGDVVLGLFLRGEGEGGGGPGPIHNAALSLGSAPRQTYAKQHLVPFGEYSPPLFGWFYRLIDLPMSDQTRGRPDQPPMQFGDQRVALNICYEDLFGAELLRSLPQASLMLNLSNLAWYGDSFAQPQHLQIARVRALETGRPMLRSTNTGMTAVIRPDGQLGPVLPAFEEGVLYAEVQGHQGLTPYARWGNTAALALASLALLATLGRFEALFRR